MASALTQNQSFCTRPGIKCFFFSPHLFSEYVNQDIQSERANTLPRKSTERRLHNGITAGRSVENPEYLVPTSPAFDNPYYLDLVSKVPGGASVSGSTSPPRQVNGYVTPTAENPEYLGLAETWSGQREGT